MGPMIVRIASLHCTFSVHIFPKSFDRECSDLDVQNQIRCDRVRRMAEDQLAEGLEAMDRIIQLTVKEL